MDEAEEGGPRLSARRVLIGLGALALAVALIGSLVVALVPRNGAMLPEAERLRLLQQAGLPLDFPVHPYARRTPQPAQGGFTYALDEPVPDVLDWQRQMLVRSGYNVFSADMPGQDEFAPHWLFFQGSAGASGAIIIRTSGTGLTSGTEVKVLSRADERLVPPTSPAGPGRR
jgi:hypothetical protein